MFFLLSGEGPTDLGRSRSEVPIALGENFEPGPMAIIVSQIVEKCHGYSPLVSQVCGFVSEAQIIIAAARIKGRRRLGLPGRKREGETGYFYSNARVLARIAIDLSTSRSDDVVAVFFRDADGSASAGRGNWDAKRQSMLVGFAAEGFAFGVPMIPKPKSEAWFICALKASPYQGCDPLEDRSGNDDSPNSLKSELETILGRPPQRDEASLRELLNSFVENGTIDFERITMPSFRAFRRRLESLIAPHSVEPA
jgi:hypothetical protein